MRRILDRVSDGELGRVVVEAGASVRAEKAARAKAMRRTVAGTGLVVAATVLVAGAQGWRALLGLVLLLAGLGGLIAARSAR